MTPQHHLRREDMIDYTTGASPEPVALVVASHLSICPQCRTSQNQLESIGGAMLDSIEPEDVSDDLLDRVIARLDDQPIETATPMAKATDGLDLPQALRHYVGNNIHDLEWSSGLGVKWSRFLKSHDGITTRLMRLAPGVKIPHHTHEGSEFTLVLHGGFSDRTGHFGRGDVEISGSELDHQPIADADGECLCLAVTTAPLRLTGPIGRYFNSLLRI